jgi:minor histocompatibility antigen H13
MMLAGLFVYDIFWVFATDVMTTVATGINAPILLMFPQDMLRHGPLAATKHSMLGVFITFFINRIHLNVVFDCCLQD